MQHYFHEPVDCSFEHLAWVAKVLALSTLADFLAEGESDALAWQHVVSVDLEVRFLCLAAWASQVFGMKEAAASSHSSTVVCGLVEAVCSTWR